MEHLQEKVSAHLVDYTSVIKLCSRKLAQAYCDLGLSKDEQLQSFEQVVAAAECVWTDACESVDVERQALRDRVDSDLREILKIKEGLGDDETDMELSQCQEEACSPRVTLRSLHERVQRRLEHWKGRRTERMGEYEAVMAVTTSLKALVGLPQQNTRPDLSRANIDFLRMEQDKLRAEKERRVRRLDSQLAQLQEQCLDIGEEYKQALAEVHPCMWQYRESHALQAAAALEAANGVPSALKQALKAEEVPQGMDLGDAMFDRLQAKIQGVVSLKGEREAQLQQLSLVLDSLWEALGVSAESVERAAVSALVHGPAKLHSSSIEACMNEVSRLEQQQSQAMKDLVVSKALEMERLCKASLMAAPDVSELLGEMSQQRSRDVMGQVSDILSKMMRMMSVVQSEAGKRAGLVAMVSELQQAQQELAWLHKYEHDENRFKGRDAHSNLQRSLRAAKARERVPAMIRGLQQAAQGWRMREGAPFLVNGSDYAEEVLPEISRQLELSLADKAAPKPKPAGGTGGGAGGGAGAGAAGRTPASSSAAVKHASSGAGGLGQAQHKALSHQGLVERHSIAVPQPSRDGPSNAQPRLGRYSDARSSQPVTPGPDDRAASRRQVAPQGKLATPERPKAQASPSQQLQATPSPSPGSGSGGKAAGGGGTPVREPMQERVARIMASPGTGSYPRTEGGGSQCSRVSLGGRGFSLAKALTAAEAGPDVESPRDNAKAAKAPGSAAAAAAAEFKEPGRGQQLGGAVQGRAPASRVGADAGVPPSPAKQSRIPRFL